MPRPWDCACGQRGNIDGACRNCSTLRPASTKAVVHPEEVFAQLVVLGAKPNLSRSRGLA